MESERVGSPWDLTVGRLDLHKKEICQMSTCLLIFMIFFMMNRNRFFQKMEP